LAAAAAWTAGGNGDGGPRCWWRWICAIDAEQNEEISTKYRASVVLESFSWPLNQGHHRLKGEVDCVFMRRKMFEFGLLIGVVVARRLVCPRCESEKSVAARLRQRKLL